VPSHIRCHAVAEAAASGGRADTQEVVSEGRSAPLHADASVLGVSCSEALAPPVGLRHRHVRDLRNLLRLPSSRWRARSLIPNRCSFRHLRPSILLALGPYSRGSLVSPHPRHGANRQSVVLAGASHRPGLVALGRGGFPRAVVSIPTSRRHVVSGVIAADPLSEMISWRASSWSRMRDGFSQRWRSALRAFTCGCTRRRPGSWSLAAGARRRSRAWASVTTGQSLSRATGWSSVAQPASGWRDSFAMYASGVAQTAMHVLRRAHEHASAGASPRGRADSVAPVAVSSESARTNGLGSMGPAHEALGASCATDYDRMGVVESGSCRVANVFAEEPDARIPHVRIWGEGGGAIPSLNRHAPVASGGTAQGFESPPARWAWPSVRA